MKQLLVGLMFLVFGTFFLNANALAQSQWLDMNPIPNWNSRSRQILRTEKMSAATLGQCAKFVRKATLPQDFLLTRNNWTLVGPAQVYGRTAVITVAEGFDGMCRPTKFETLVFVGNRVAGKLSPGPMDSRTDGYLTTVRLISETDITSEYARYRASDPLCCPYKTEAVTWTIKPDGGNFLLTPEAKVQVGTNNTGENQPAENEPFRPAANPANLRNAVWQWESVQTPVEKVTVDKPENYTLEFKEDGSLLVQADCNRGRGKYSANGKSINLSNIALTRRGCPPGSLDGRFTRGLAAAQNFFFEGDALYIDMQADGGTMRFVKTVR
jgi:heat shock protein HslJ